jgi:adenine-specific DNA-methyltransferase
MATCDVTIEADMMRIELPDNDKGVSEQVSENIAALTRLFPELITEISTGHAIDIEVLKQLVGDRTVEQGDERFGLSWHGKRAARQLALTSSRGTLRPAREDSVDWDGTQNLMIEGDNLEVLKLLQKSLAGKVKLIYIDPPYNTGKDFVYRDDFRDGVQHYLEVTGQSEGSARISSNTEAGGRYHTDWLNMMYPRLHLAYQLLRDDGFIAVSISDDEHGHLRLMLDEIFGDKNLVETFVWHSTFRPSNMSRKTRNNAEFVLLYAKDAAREFELFERSQDPQGDASLTQNNNKPRVLTFPAGVVRVNLPDRTYNQGKYGEIVLHNDLVVQSGTNVNSFQIEGKFAWSQEYLDNEINSGVTLSIKSSSMIPYYRKDYKQTVLRPTKILPNDLIGDVLAASAEVRALFAEDIFSYPKPTSLIKFLITAIKSSADDVVVDFFAGSGTTGHAVMAQNAADGGSRRFVLVQLPEPLDPEVKEQKVAAEFCDVLGKPRNIAELTKERLRRAGEKVRAENPMFAGDVGFRVFKLDSSNLTAWDPDREDLEESLLAAVESVKSDRSESDVLYELLLRLGIDLCVPIEEREIAGKMVYAVGGGVLLACLAERVAREDVEGLAEGIVGWIGELEPVGDVTCVFRDAAFDDDVVKTNVTAVLEQHGVTTVRSI